MKFDPHPVNAKRSILLDLIAFMCGGIWQSDNCYRFLTYQGYCHFVFLLYGKDYIDDIPF